MSLIVNDIVHCSNLKTKKYIFYTFIVSEIADKYFTELSLY